MSDNIIQFKRNCSPAQTAPESPRQRPLPKTRVTTHEGDDRDRRCKTGAKSRSIEPNITQISGNEGKSSFRVKLRKSLGGVQQSFTGTFSTLSVARKWKKRKLAEFELHGVQIVARSGDTVADAIDARLAAHQHLGRSAKQQLNWIKKSALGQHKLGALSIQDLLKLADEMLVEDRAPQTVAGYLTILVHSLDWASRRNFIVPVETLRIAMQQMWEDEVLARSEARERRPTLEELSNMLRVVTSNKRQKIPLAKIILFAIFSCRRLGEICRLRWDDLRIEERKLLVRDMKHPRKKVSGAPPPPSA